MSDLLAHLDVFFGDLTVNHGYVYARLPRPADDAGLKLSGQVRGPRCRHAETLPASFSLVDLGAGPTILSRAVVPEPCFWTPELPAIYDVTVTLLRGGTIVETARREIGFRALGVRGRHLVLASKPWVLRGVAAASTIAALPRQWHEESAAYVMTELNPERLREASEWGALAVVAVGEGEQAIGRLRELALHPAAAMAAVEGDLPRDFSKSSVAPNILLAQVVTAGSTSEPHSWADVLLASADDSEQWTDLLGGRLPVIAMRTFKTPADLAIARAACDTLQRDLAPLGQFAGYIV